MFFFFPHFFIECVYVFSVVREEEEERDRGGAERNREAESPFGLEVWVWFEKSRGWDWVCVWNKQVGIALLL